MKNFLLFSLIILLHCSCNQDADPFDTLTQDSWTYTEIIAVEPFVLGDGSVLEGDLLADADECDRAREWIFNPDFSLTIRVDQMGCSNSETWGDWTLEDLVFITHERTENEFLVHTIETINEDEITGILELDDSNFVVQRRTGKASFVLVRNQ